MERKNAVNVYALEAVTRRPSILVFTCTGENGWGIGERTK
jgi:hypothetical protein